MSEQWVQSKYSKDAVKWKVVDNASAGFDEWPIRKVVGERFFGDYHYFSKSEYVLCDPPERWETLLTVRSVDKSYLMFDGGNMRIYTDNFGNKRIERKVQP